MKLGKKEEESNDSNLKQFSPDDLLKSIANLSRVDSEHILKNLTKSSIIPNSESCSDVTVKAELDKLSQDPSKLMLF